MNWCNSKEVLCPAIGQVKVKRSLTSIGYTKSPHRYVIVDVPNKKYGKCQLGRACPGCTQHVAYVELPFPAVVAVGAFTPVPAYFDTDLDRAVEDEKNRARVLAQAQELRRKMGRFD